MQSSTAAESVSKAQRVPRAICNEYETDKALVIGAHFTRGFVGGSRHRHRGVSNPPGRPRDGSRRRTGGLLCTTVLLLATAPAPAPPGGRHRAPPEDDGLQPPRRSAVAGRAHRVRAALVD
jgi:hypothetical protein